MRAPVSDDRILTNARTGPTTPTDDYSEDSEDSEGEGDYEPRPGVSRERLEEAREALIALLDAESLRICQRLLAVVEAGKEAERMEAEQNARAGITSREPAPPKEKPGKRKANGCPAERGPRDQNLGCKTLCEDRNMPTILEEDPIYFPNGSGSAQVRI